MLPTDAAPYRRHCRPRTFWLIWGYLLLAALLIAPPSAPAQATVYVLGHGPGPQAEFRSN